MDEGNLELFYTFHGCVASFFFEKLKKQKRRH